MSQRHPNNHFIGYENSKRPYNLALKKKAEYQGNYSVSNEDFFHASLAEVNVAYAYLLPHLMLKIWQKIESECQP